MRNYVCDKQGTSGQSDRQHNHGHYYCDNGPSERHLSQGKNTKHLLRRSQEIQGLRDKMPNILLGRYEERRLTQPKNHCKIGHLYLLETKRKSILALRTLYNSNYYQRLCELRSGSLKDL
jgi:hypothetical protein